jgi:hypothetical protein
MAGKRRKKIREPEVTGLKYFKKLLPLLERLHDDGCARDKAGNRRLHFDQYCTLILLYLFNPVVTSLRGLQQASELGKVQKSLAAHGPLWDPFPRPPQSSIRSDSRRSSPNWGKI